MNTNTTPDIEQAQRDFDAARERLELAKQAQAEKLKTDFHNALKAAQKPYDSISSLSRLILWKDKALIKTLAGLGLQPLTVKAGEDAPAETKKPRANRKDITKEDVLAYITERKEVSKGEIDAKFADVTTPVTVGKRIKELLEDATIEFNKVGTKKLYHAVWVVKTL